MPSGFGWVEWEGIRYEYDLVIHTDSTVTKREKKKSKKLKADFGHTPLSEHELGFLDKEKPEVVFIGTGMYGSLPVTPQAKKMLLIYDSVILPTPDVLSRMESEGRRYVAIIHVTC